MNGFADWLAATAQMQQAMQGLQAQFRLSEHEMREATDALAPAFLLGLRRLQANQAAFATPTSPTQRSPRTRPVWRSGSGAVTCVSSHGDDFGADGRNPGAGGALRS